MSKRMRMNLINRPLNFYLIAVALFWSCASKPPVPPEPEPVVVIEPEPKPEPEPVVAIPPSPPEAISINSIEYNTNYMSIKWIHQKKQILKVTPY